MSWGVQQHGNNFANGGSATTISVTPGAAVTSGNLLVVFAGSFGGGTLTIADDKSNSYGSPIVTGSFANSYPVGVWALKNVTNGPSTFTMNTTVGGGYPMIQVTEFNVVGTPSGVALDQTGEVNFSGSTAVTGSITTTANNELLYGAFASAGGPMTAGSGYTAIDIFDTFWLTEWGTQSTAGTVAITGTQSASANCTVLMASFSPGAAVSSVVERKTFSSIGGRVASRQPFMKAPGLIVPSRSIIRPQRDLLRAA